MSLRSGNNKKKGQKHQNTYAFKHNKGSMKTRQILSVPLDFLCERCLDIMEWKLNYRKYKPLTTASRCNICGEKKIYKAYRTICEECATKDGKKICTKCGEPVESYAQPQARNNPHAGTKKKSPIIDLVKSLKKKYQKTVYRKINSGVAIDYDEAKGIINKETGEIIVSLENIADKAFEDDEDLEEDEDDNEEEEDKEDNPKKEEVKEGEKKEVPKKPVYEEEIIDTSKKNI